MVRSIICVTWMLVLVGCATSTDSYDVSVSEQSQVLRGEYFLTVDELKQPIDWLLPDEKPFHVSEDMKRFAHFYAPKNLGQEQRTRALIKALISPYGLGIKYSTDRTLTAEQTFLRAEANCLSFTMLFAVLAEEVGLPVTYNDVGVPPIWDLQDNDRLIRYKHVNAVVGMKFAKDKVVDINMADFDARYKQVALSPVQAEALYYNNRGAEEMYAGNLKSAFLMYRKAISLDPDMELVWSNIGALYLRVGEVDIARYAYIRAMGKGAFNAVAASGLARVLRMKGEDAAAAQIEDRLRRYRDKNPYYMYAQAAYLVEHGDYDEAKIYAKRAISLYELDHRFYRLLAFIYLKQGDKVKVFENLEEAKLVAANDAVKDEYDAKLIKLRQLSRK